MKLFCEREITEAIFARGSDEEQSGNGIFRIMIFQVQYWTDQLLLKLCERNTRNSNIK